MENLCLCLFWSLWSTSRLSGFIPFPSHSWSPVLLQASKSLEYNTLNKSASLKLELTFISFWKLWFLKFTLTIRNYIYKQENQRDEKIVLIYCKSHFSLTLARRTEALQGLPIQGLTEILWETASSSLVRQLPSKNNCFISRLNDVFVFVS